MRCSAAGILPDSYRINSRSHGALDAYLQQRVRIALSAGFPGTLPDLTSAANQTPSANCKIRIAVRPKGYADCAGIGRRGDLGGLVRLGGTDQNAGVDCADDNDNRASDRCRGRDPHSSHLCSSSGTNAAARARTGTRSHSRCTPAASGGNHNVASGDDGNAATGCFNSGGTRVTTACHSTIANTARGRSAGCSCTCSGNGAAGRCTPVSPGGSATASSGRHSNSAQAR